MGKSRPQTKNTNGALCLVYVIDWRDMSIGAVKKAVRLEIGQTTIRMDGNNTGGRQDTPWPDVDVVRYINKYGSLAKSLLEVAYTPEKADIVCDFFTNQGITVFYGQLNPCVDPTLVDDPEEDTVKIAKRMKKHFLRVLLAWWKGAHYISSPDTRLYYKRTLQKLISGDNKLFKWPAFVKAIHIDAGEVNGRKDNPRIWFEYKDGYEYLKEDGTDMKAAVKVQSFSTYAANAVAPAARRKRQRGEEEGA